MPATALRLAVLFLLLLPLYACNSFVSIDVAPDDLPAPVVGAIEQRWPGAKIRSADRTFGLGSWGNYTVTFESAAGEWRSAGITRDGRITLEWPERYAEP